MARPRPAPGHPRIITWNLAGLVCTNKKQRVRKLRALYKIMKYADIILLQETHFKQRERAGMEKAMRRCGFVFYHTPGRGKGRAWGAAICVWISWLDGRRVGEMEMVQRHVHRIEIWSRKGKLDRGVVCA